MKNRRFDRTIREVTEMLLILALILVALWVVGLVVKWTIGGVIHILLGIAIILVVLHFVRGRKAV